MFAVCQASGLALGGELCRESEVPVLTERGLLGPDEMTEVWPNACVIGRPRHLSGSEKRR